MSLYNPDRAGAKGGTNGNGHINTLDQRRNWELVTKQDPCGICGHARPCKRTRDGTVAMCKRVEAGAFKSLNGGWHLHRLEEDGGRSGWRPTPKPGRAAHPAAKGRRQPKAHRDLEEAVEAVRQQIMRDHELTPGDVSPAGQWTYLRADLSEALRVLRFDVPDDKEYRPVHRTKDGWRIGDPSGKLPLYHLPELVNAGKSAKSAKSGFLWVLEGEKAADLAATLGFTTTTSAHGAESADRSDWSPLAAFAEVLICPDNDEPGAKYARDVARHVAALNPTPTIRIVTLPGLPEHGDIVEFVQGLRAEGKPAAEIRAELERLASETPESDPAEFVGGPVLIRASDVTPRKVEWLVWDRVALGKINLFSGDPGVGKGLTTLSIAAHVTRGDAMPFAPDHPLPCGDVVLLSAAEDDPDDTIVPRLTDAGADLTRVQILKAVKRVEKDGTTTTNPFALDRDLEQLERALQLCPRTKLVVIDPISAYLGEADSYKDAEVRRVLTPLGELAARYRVAVLIVAHLNKNETAAVMYRTGASIGFNATSRIVWMFLKDKSDERRRLILPVKNNLAGDGVGMAYSIVATDDTVQVAWEPEPVRMTATEAMAQPADDEERLARDGTVRWLRTALSQGPLSSGEVLRQAKASGIGEKAVRAAAQKLGVKEKPGGFQQPWTWSLPDEPPAKSGEVCPDLVSATPDYSAKNSDLADLADFSEEGEL